MSQFSQFERLMRGEDLTRKPKVAPIIRAVYCWMERTLVPADVCSHCEHRHGYAFRKDGDKFGPLCDQSLDGYEATLVPCRD